MNPTVSLVLVFIAALAAPACRRTGGEGPGVSAAPPHAAAVDASKVTGTVGPLGSDCFDSTGAPACPPDPTDPSGRKLPAHGGACARPVCRPCGSETAPSFRDPNGLASAGFCICVPMSDDSGRGTYSCYGPEAWRKRGQ